MKLNHYFSLKDSSKTYSGFFPRYEIANDSKELFEKFISKTIANKNNVIRWHKLLVNYLFQTKNPIIFVRLYESDTSNKIDGVQIDRNRRACLTIAKDKLGQEVRYLFVSNHDASELCNIVKQGVEEDLDLFERMINSFEYPLHYQKQSPIDDYADFLAYLNTKVFPSKYSKPKSIQEETYIHANFKNIGSPMSSIINKSQRYLAHIIGVKDTPFLYLQNGKEEIIEASELSKIMPRGNITDWVSDSALGYVRRSSNIISDRDLALMKAHCLRFLDPLNYFATPSNTFSNVDGTMAKNKNIGEYYQVQKYVRDKYIDLYGQEIIDEFNKYALVPSDSECFKTTLGKGQAISFNKIEYGFDVHKKRNQTTNNHKTVGTPKHKYSESAQLELAMFFLTNDLTYSQLDKNVLKCSTDRHGNTSFTLIKKMGLVTDDKNSLSHYSIDDLISSANGKRKDTLNKVKEKYNL